MKWMHVYTKHVHDKLHERTHTWDLLTRFGGCKLPHNNYQYHSSNFILKHQYPNTHFIPYTIM